MRLFLIASLLLISSNAYAYNQTYNPFTGRLDYVGIGVSSDVSIPCPSGQVMLSAGGGNWACGTAGGSGSVPTGTGFYHINAGNADASARAVNLASADVTGTLALGNGGTGLTSISNDAVLVGNNAGTGFDAPALSDCVGAGKAVTYTAATNTFGCNTIAGGSGAGSATASFTNADLVAGVYTFTHNLGVTYPIITVYNSTDSVQVVDDIKYRTTNQVSIDVTSVGTLPGTWNVRAVG